MALEGRRAGAEPIFPEGADHGDWVTSLAFSPEVGLLASGSRDNTVRLWSTRGPGRELRCLQGHKHWVSSVAFSPGGKMLAAGVLDGTVWLWDLQDSGRPPGPRTSGKGWTRHSSSRFASRSVRMGVC